MPIQTLKVQYRKLLAIQKRLARQARSTRLKFRWKTRRIHKNSSVSSPSKSEDVFSRLNIVVINLDSRPDRLAEFKSEMSRMNISNWRRLPGIDGRREYPELDAFYAGSIGCSLSHAKALEDTNWSGKDGILICEDDVEFLVDRDEISHAITEFLDNPSLDVLALYGRARGGSHRISERLRIVVGLVGTVCYVVKPHMARVIEHLFLRGVEDLKKKDRKGKSDVLWDEIQKKKFFFAAPNETYAQNREGYSDIEGKTLGPR